MNEPLRRALLRARLREDDVAARLGVDPKTVRRWLNGRLPYPHNRAAIAELVGADEAELWPDAGGLLAARHPEEVATPEEPTYRSAILPGGMLVVLLLALVQARVTHAPILVKILLEAGLVLCSGALVARSALLGRRLRGRS